MQATRWEELEPGPAAEEQRERGEEDKSAILGDFCLVCLSASSYFLLPAFSSRVSTFSTRQSTIIWHTSSTTFTAPWSSLFSIWGEQGQNSNTTPHQLMYSQNQPVQGAVQTTRTLCMIQPTRNNAIVLRFAQLQGLYSPVYTST